MEKLTRCRMRTGSIPSEGQWTVAAIPLVEEPNLFAGDRPPEMQFHEVLLMSCFRIIFCVQTNRVLRVRVCSASTSRLWAQVILILSANVGIKSASASALGLKLSKSLSWVPFCNLTGWFLNDITIFLKVLYWGLPVRQRLWYQHTGAPTNYRECVWQWLKGWKRRIEEAGLDGEGRLHSLLGHRT
jgi:hypothetical protein